MRRMDSGASVAHAFAGRPGINAVLVYPSGQVRGLDPATLVQEGGNILPVQAKGTFDDCQELTRRAILDRDFSARYGVTSANTINPGRLLPQVFYYLYAFIQAKRAVAGDIAFSVPCGNFGNLMAGLYAWKFGLPVSGFVAAMNANNPLGGFLGGGTFTPRAPVRTKSPAIDVSSPSNLSRLASFYRDSPAVMRSMVYPASVGDEETLRTMGGVWKKYGVHIDAHTAVAFAAAEKTAAAADWKGHTHTVVLSTMHHAKEPELVYLASGVTVEVPKRFAPHRGKVNPAVVIPPDLDTFEGVIAGNF